MGQIESYRKTSEDQKLKVLLVIEQCNPEWSSVPLVGYRFFREINKLADVTLVTHERNQNALQERGYTNVIYMSEGALVKQYYRLVGPIASKIWALYHTLTYPIYAEFNHNVYQQFKASIQAGKYDIVHVITPMMPRYPVKTIKACEKVPMLLGPVNGGVPFPDGFQEVARKEHAYLNFLRDIGRWMLPGYVETYQKVSHILSGSTFTLNFLKQQFSLPDEQISLFYENGIESEFLEQAVEKQLGQKVSLLFVGRLVPYKGADMLIDALGRLNLDVRQKINLTIVGDGVERQNLERQVQQLHLEQHVHFTGWIDSGNMLPYYKQADVFCFPSVREFGGAVVMEAMACGLPCIVVDNGGIGEYVTEETGFKIQPISRKYVVQELSERITELINKPELYQHMSKAAIVRASSFEWGYKARQIVGIYHKLLQK